MEHWVVVPIGEIAEINPRLEKNEIAEDLEVSFVPMSAVGAGNGSIDVSQNRPFSEVQKGYTSFAEGDVLFAKITPCMENGKIAIVPQLRNIYGFGSTEFHVLRPTPAINSRYLYYFVSRQQFRRDAEHNMTGAVGQRRVPAPYLCACGIPVPPYKEQLRIVTKIEELFSELDKGVESLETAQEQLKVYRQALLKHAFEGKLTSKLPAFRNGNLQTKRLSALISLLTSGSRGWAQYYSSTGDLFIRAQNLKHDCLDLTERVSVSLPDDVEGVRTRVRPGDILITITGANVTKAAIVENDIGVAYVSQHVALCRLKRDAFPKYLYYYLIAEAAGRRQLSNAAYGAGKPGLNLENIRAVVVPLPSYEEQQVVVEIIEQNLSEVDQLEKTIRHSIAQAQMLRQSILKKAFAGQLVPEEPNDEPTSALLAHIKRAGLKRTVARTTSTKIKRKKAPK